ncbi:MAG: hypothetical protein GY774_12260 [Planctomycetes bacterium]|nr:hypothetical protein [Planctomycetota bacterium]|tara:strand:- start:851 stop:1252 length:402 start_codon:yes stop_codon:yes gene_type:complete
MTTQKTTKPATVADFVEENAEIIFTVFDGGKIGLNQDSVPYIRELLITLFKTPHKLKAGQNASGLIVPGYGYELLDKTHPRAPLSLVLKDSSEKQGNGEYVISLEEFINAFSDAFIPGTSFVVKGEPVQHATA